MSSISRSGTVRGAFQRVLGDGNFNALGGRQHLGAGREAHSHTQHACCAADIANNLLPDWLAPNLITLMGLFALMVAYVVAAVYLPEFHGKPPGPAWHRAWKPSAAECGELLAFGLAAHQWPPCNPGGPAAALCDLQASRGS